MSSPRKKIVGPRQLRRRSKAETDKVFASVSDHEFLIGEDEIDLNKTVIIPEDSSDSQSYCSSESSATNVAIADAIEFDLPSPDANNADNEIVNPISDEEENQHCLIYVRKDLFTAASYDNSPSSSSDKKRRACRKRRNPEVLDYSVSDMDEEGSEEEENQRKKNKRGKVQSSGSAFTFHSFNDISENLTNVMKKKTPNPIGVRSSEQPLSLKSTVSPSDACEKPDCTASSQNSQNGGRGKENQQKANPQGKTGANKKKSSNKPSDSGTKPSRTQGPGTSKASEQSFRVKSSQTTQKKEPSKYTNESFRKSFGSEVTAREQDLQQNTPGSVEQTHSPRRENNGATRVNKVADVQQLPDRTLNPQTTSTPDISVNENGINSSPAPSPVKLDDSFQLNHKDSFSVSLNATIKDNIEDNPEGDRPSELQRSLSPTDIVTGTNITDTGPKKRPQKAHIKVLSSKQLLKMTVHDILKVQYERQSRMEEEIRAMRASLEEMRQLLMNRSEVLQHPKGFPTLPLKTFDDARIAEDLVKHNTAMKDYLVKKLSFASRGNSDSECSKKVMALLMTNHTGTFFNWKGQNNKQAFSQWTLKDIVLQTIKNLRPEMDSKIAENGIKEWCKGRKFAKNNVF